ncbi:hypothetical protein KBB96_11945 [Luteolibacter ambystomatis]|uniref:DUF4175 family protein n=1 Tax=Luteolibacter ambystomatis TaxID=2824561 RepID=A0A975G788_9BACT|nr:hypothetical protein [Luteolibacter ambystomatis]QUE49585.1 hypothetical protein KBB96_11945 [Luteolibacter ambystomatis]
MSERPPSPPPVPIPESLRLQLEEFRRVLWRIKVQEAVIAGVIGLLVSFLVVYGLDRIWQTPALVRLAILLGGTSVFAVFAPFWIHRWVWRHRRENQLAQLIARRFPGLGDRLLGVIELQNQDENVTSLSPRLRAAAMEAVAAEASARTLAEALPPARHRKWALAALVLAAGVATIWVVAPRAGTNALRRWLMPLSDTPRYTFTMLDSPPTEVAVPFGEAFDLTLRLANDTERRPPNASGRYGLQPPVATDLAEDSYHFQFPGQQDPGTIVFHIGDAVHETRIIPVQRPAAEGTVARVIPPAYLGIPEKTIELDTGVLSVVEGSQVDVRIRTSRALSSAHFGPTVANRIPSADAKDASPFVPVEGDLILKGREAHMPLLAVGQVPFDIPFSWKDEYGLGGGGSFKLRVDPLRDAAPTAYLQGIERQKVMLPEETIDLEALAEDDFGLKTAGIEWQGEFSRPTDETPATGGMKLSDGGTELRRFSGPVAFSPGAFGIGPQKLTLRAYSEDYLPGRPRMYSEPVTLYILSRDEHAQMLKNQFDRAITELEDLARRERNQLEENERIERLDGADLQKEENRARLDAQQQAEAENTRRMQELSQRMEQLMKDSTRNGEIDKNTLKKMAESMKSMQELSTQDLPKVDSKLGDANEETNTPEKTKKDVQDAVKEQQKAVEKMQAAIEKANDANRRFEAGTFVSRLKKAASEEESIVNTLVKRYSETLGLKANELDPADQRMANESIRQQSDTASDVRWIQEDLGHYYTRTEKATFKEILDEMRESKIDLGLEDIRNRLQIARNFTATEGAKEWATRLGDWARKLEGEMNQQNGGGQGGGQGNSEDEDFEFMLRVMKMVQQEMDIRAQTRALEQLQRSRQSTPATPSEP